MGGSFPAAALAPVDGLVARGRGRRARPRRGRPAPGGGRPGRPAPFAHALIRQTLHDELGPVVRAHLHERIAQTLESQRAELRPTPPSWRTTSTRRATRSGPEPALRYAREPPTAPPARSPGRTPPRSWSARSSSTSCASRPIPDDRCELLLRARRHAPARRSSRLLGGLRRGRRPRAGPLQHPARARRDRLRGPLLRGRRGRPDADRAAARGAGGARATTSRTCAPGCSPGSPRSCTSPATRRSRMDAGARRRWRSRASWATTSVLAAALAGRHMSLLHVRHLERAAGVERGGDRSVSTQIGDRERTLQGLQARIFDLVQAGQGRTKDVPASRSSRRLAEEVRQPLFEHFAVAGRPSFAQMEGRLDEAERLAAESAVMRRRMETRGRRERVRRAAVPDSHRRRGACASWSPAVEQFVDGVSRLAAWRAGLPLGYLADGRDEDARRSSSGLVAGARRAAAGLLLAHDVALLAEASAKLRAHRERRRFSTTRSRRTPAAWCRWATPAASGRCRAPARPARRRARRPRRRRRAPRVRARLHGGARACACSRRRPARARRSSRTPSALTARHYSSSGGGRPARPAGPPARPAAPARRRPRRCSDVRLVRALLASVALRAHAHGLARALLRLHDRDRSRRFSSSSGALSTSMVEPGGMDCASTSSASGSSM